MARSLNGSAAAAPQADTKFAAPVRIEVTMASQSAIKAIEESGGSIKSVYYGRVALRALLKPELFAVMPKNPQPSPRLLPYYTEFKNRGYLSPELQLMELRKASPMASSSAVETPAAAARVE